MRRKKSRKNHNDEPGWLKSWDAERGLSQGGDHGGGHSFNPPVYHPQPVKPTQWWHREPDISEQIEDIVNPYQKSDALTEGYFRMFARMMAPSFNVEVYSGNKWGKVWGLKPVVRYSIQGESLNRMQVQARLIASMSSVVNAKQPKVNLRRAMNDKLVEISKAELKALQTDKSNNLAHGSLNEWYAFPFQGKEGEEINDHLRLVKVGNEEYVNRLSEVLDERRAFAEEVKAYRKRRTLATAYDKVNRKQLRSNTKKLKAVVEMLKPKGGSLNHVFKHRHATEGVDNPEFNPARYDKETREQIRLLSFNVVLGTFIAQEKAAQHWVKPMRDMLKALQDEEKALGNVKTTAGVVRVVRRVWENTLKDGLLEGLEYDAQNLPQAGGGLGTEIARVRREAKQALKGGTGARQANQGVNHRLNRLLGIKGGNHPSTYNGQLDILNRQSIRRLMENIKAVVRDEFIRNDLNAWESGHRRGKLNVKQAYKHRLDKYNLFRRRTVKEVGYHFTIAIDVSGSVNAHSMGENDKEGESSLKPTSATVFAQEWGVLKAMLEAFKEMDIGLKSRFTLLSFDTMPTELTWNVNAAEALQTLNGLHIPYGGGTEISHALKAVEKGLTVDMENIVFVLTDGNDFNPEEVQARWKHIVKVVQGRAWAYCFNPKGVESEPEHTNPQRDAFGVNVTQVVNDKHFARHLRETVKTML